uniref:Uncharacterized protein ycf23 n=1 Tax=Crouania attenuata TaxID=42002 RepID=A0A4D6WRR9_9FLOR|nr:hypothetical protein [Crouania attenuata]
MRHNVLKVIAGINNFRLDQIVKLVKASELVFADYIDIAANYRLVSIIKSISNLPVCASSIEPLELYNCVLAGADLVELGNFDTFYSSNIYLSADEILKLAIETRSLLPHTYLSVTIPHVLSLDEQVKLSINLENIGVNMLQTEGYNTSKILKNINSKYNDNFLSSTTQASSALSSLNVITQVVSIPVIAASGFNSISSSIARSYKSFGVAIGSYLKKYNNLIDISCRLHEIIRSLSYQNIKYSNDDCFYLRMNALNLNKSIIIKR